MNKKAFFYFLDRFFIYRRDNSDPVQVVTGSSASYAGTFNLVTEV